MNSREFSVPAISCGHCVRTIQREIGEVPGVDSVEADAQTQRVKVRWQEPPASWETIRAALQEIHYAPAE